jgi:CheY-like chemotaxis protein
LDDSSFPYRILIVEDDPRLREVGKLVLETQGYEVHVAGDGFEALLALKRSLPDIIISDLSMPNMNGFELLSVVRRRFPTIPVIVISGEFSVLTVPESVLADAFFPKGQYRPEALFQKILELIRELPSRPRTGRPDNAAVWVKNNKGMIAVTCTDCLRTFPVLDVSKGVNSVPCEFCPCVIRFELIEQ